MSTGYVKTSVKFDLKMTINILSTIFMHQNHFNKKNALSFLNVFFR